MKKIFLSKLLITALVFANHSLPIANNDSTFFVFDPPLLTANVGESVKLNIKLIDKIIILSMYHLQCILQMTQV